MGRRAKKAPVQTKKRPTLAKRFKCPFCNHEGTVECKMDRTTGLGSLLCRLCGADFQMPIHHLHEPIDVFSEWLDECNQAALGVSGEGQSGTAHGSSSRLYQDDDDEDDEDDLGEASGLTRVPQAHDEDGSLPRSPTTATATGATSSSLTTTTTTTGATTTATEKPSYATLGLDDSDSDDEDE